MCPSRLAFISACVQLLKAWESSKMAQFEIRPSNLLLKVRMPYKQPLHLKMEAALTAIAFIEDNMTIGLGSGSTAKIFVDLLGDKIRQGLLKNIIGVATSNATASQAAQLGIPIGQLANYPKLDIAVDGADEVDPQLNLIKGWGGALVREKLVEIQAKRLVIMVDERKLVDRLGTRGALPIEVTQFGWQVQQNWLSQTLNCAVTRREDNGTPYITDNQNYILHCHFKEGIEDAYKVRDMLAHRPGLVGHGLFLDLATDVIISSEKGTQIKTRK